MKKILLYSLFLITNLTTLAQDNNSVVNEGVNKEKIAQTIDALKIAYITKELNLTSDEAQKFWPVYNGFTTEIKKAKLEFKQDDIAFEEKKVGLMKKYRDDFKKLLNNDDRVKKCFRAEPEFHKILRNEWHRRQSMKQQNRDFGGRQQGIMQQERFNNNPPTKSGSGGMRNPRRP